MDAQAHIVYSGTVQGVGFRYTVQSIAKELGLTGWVKNLKDGRVEILAEGKKHLLEQLMAETEKHFDGYIKDKDIFYKEAQNTFKGFQIAY